jgi:prephenate dehydrogenase
MISPRSSAVLIIGGRGEFGQFLQRDILPVLGVDAVLTIERDTPRDQHSLRIQQARHIVMSTPLAGYAERACELVQQCRDVRQPTALWFISSVQANVWQAVTATLAEQRNQFLAAAFVHPMYGPNGFRANEREAPTFRNILTALIEGPAHLLANEVARIGNAFRSKLSIETTTGFNPREHDRITAYSQGLSYCLGRMIFDRPDLDELLRDEMPDLHQSFHANHDLIIDFLRINAYTPEVISVFRESWEQTSQASYRDLLTAFAQADQVLNGGNDSLIPTKWYQKLRAASRGSF